VEYAFNMAEEADAQLTLLHVVELPNIVTDEPAVLDVDFSRIRDATAARATRKLQALVPEQAQTYCTVDTAVVNGRACREILQQAAAR
jgi:hypothetical protein